VRQFFLSEPNGPTAKTSLSATRCQPPDQAEHEVVMRQEAEGGPWEFLLSAREWRGSQTEDGRGSRLSLSSFSRVVLDPPGTCKNQRPRWLMGEALSRRGTVMLVEQKVSAEGRGCRGR
jgi:hypothetical protein